MNVVGRRYLSRLQVRWIYVSDLTTQNKLMCGVFVNSDSLSLLVAVCAFSSGTQLGDSIPMKNWKNFASTWSNNLIWNFYIHSLAELEQNNFHFCSETFYPCMWDYAIMLVRDFLNFPYQFCDYEKTSTVGKFLFAQVLNFPKSQVKKKEREREDKWNKFEGFNEKSERFEVIYKWNKFSSPSSSGNLRTW